MARVRAIPGVVDVRPTTHDRIALRDADGRAVDVEVVGVDLSRALPSEIEPRTTVPGPFVRDGGTPAFGEVVADDGVLISRALAAQFGVRVGSRLHASPQIALRVAGITRGLRAGVDSRVAFVDIATAQRLFARAGRIDRIDVVVRPESLAAARARASVGLPAGVRAIEPESLARADAHLASDVRADLDLFAILALLVGAAAIASALAISVEARRADIGMLRTIGATRAQIFAAFVSEGALLGGIGSLLGLGCGVTTAQATVPALLTRVDGVSFEFAHLLRAFACGVAAAIVAAIVPARDAAATRPAVAMRARGFEASFVAPARVYGATAIVLVIASIALRGRGAAIASIAAAISSVPSIVVWLGGLPRRAPARFATILAMALRDLAATVRRSSVAIVALALAIATTTAAAIFADSFASTLSARAERASPGDLRVSAPDCATHLASRVRAFDDVARVDERAGGIVVTMRSARDVVGVRQRIERERGRCRIAIEDTREIRRTALARSRTTQGVALGIVLATFAIAMLGVGTTFVALVFERRREIAMLRYVGMTARDVRDTILWNATIVGALASAIGLVLGVALGVRLVGATGADALGGEVALHVPLPTLAAIAFATIACALVAGIYPAHLASRIRAGGAAA